MFATLRSEGTASFTCRHCLRKPLAVEALLFLLDLYGTARVCPFPPKSGTSAKVLARRFPERTRKLPLAAKTHSQSRIAASHHVLNGMLLIPFFILRFRLQNNLRLPRRQFRPHRNPIRCPSEIPWAFSRICRMRSSLSPARLRRGRNGGVFYRTGADSP